MQVSDLCVLSMLAYLHKDTLSCVCPSLSTLYNVGPADRRLCCSPVQCACRPRERRVILVVLLWLVSLDRAVLKCTKASQQLRRQPVTAGGQLLIGLQTRYDYAPIRGPFR